jgi:dienelactone hydrolase
MGITLWQHLSDRARRLADHALQDVRTAADWQRIRPVRHKQFMQSLGLDPLPEKCDLRVTELGSFDGPGYVATKIAFTILPDCWSTAIVYAPAQPAATKLPGIPGVLYLCGHHPSGTDSYQNHGIMWARRGYLCLMLDTIEQSHNPGEHHGTYKGLGERWSALGYSAAGGETWNSLRALDVLSSDARVDPNRIGVTGLSGGGALGLWLAIADERVRAVTSLCGISTPVDAIANRHLTRHCDCFYPRNPHALDTSDFAALIAPRALVVCSALDDALFHPSEVRAFAARTKRVYELLGVPEKCLLVETPGLHGDHPAFDAATDACFDTYVSGQSHPHIERGKREVPEMVTTIFNGNPPSLNHIALLPELLSPRSNVALPRSAQDWPAVRGEAIAALQAQVPGLRRDALPAMNMKLDNTWLWGVGARMFAHRGEVDGVEVWLHAAVHPKRTGPLVISVVNPGEISMNAVANITDVIDPTVVGFAGFEPRVAGFGSAAPTSRVGVPGAGAGAFGTVERFTQTAMSLVGTSAVLMTIQDLLLMLRYIKNNDELRTHEIVLHGRGDSGVAVIYAAMLDESVSAVVAEDVPASHIEGSAIPGVLRAIDLPIAAGLLAPRKLALISRGHGNWNWTSAAYRRTGAEGRLIVTQNARDGFTQLFK